MKLHNIEINDFNIVDFLETAIEKGQNFLNVPVFLVDDLDSIDFYETFNIYGHAEVPEMLHDLVEGKYLFVNFSDCGVNHPNVACIDGAEYRMIKKSEEEEYFDGEGAPKDFVFTENLFLGESSSIGYILTYVDDKISIESAQLYIDGIELIEDVEVFEMPMKNYLKSFLK
ncbi:hypothetical protein [Niallia sp. Krafla_26]|uniref:hypothetical protein n=1 Tax=Niallia sp. Krafla_26 TaxID=3064703 RepID=UPI003D166669